MFADAAIFLLTTGIYVCKQNRKNMRNDHNDSDFDFRDYDSKENDYRENNSRNGRYCASERNREIKQSISNNIRDRKRKLCKKISQEKLAFMDGAELGSISIAIEDGATKRKIRKIIEKRVCKEYWKRHTPNEDYNDQHRANTQKNISSITRRIYGDCLRGFSYAA